VEEPPSYRYRPRIAPLPSRSTRERETGEPASGRTGRSISRLYARPSKRANAGTIATGHLNFSDLVTLQAVATAAQELAVPVMVRQH
jgi:hypothetical protein